MTRSVRYGGRPQSQELDRAIRAATLELLAEVGYEALSLAEVARRAGSTTPAIYRRYANKMEIVMAAIEDDLARIDHLPPDSGNLHADLIGWTEGIARMITPQRSRILLGILFAGTAARPVRDKLADSFYRRITTEWSLITSRAVKRGELVKNRIPRLLSRLPAALVSHYSMIEETHDRALPRELVETIVMPALCDAGALVVSPRRKNRGA